MQQDIDLSTPKNRAVLNWMAPRVAVYRNIPWSSVINVERITEDCKKAIGMTSQAVAEYLRDRSLSGKSWSTMTIDNDEKPSHWAKDEEITPEVDDEKDDESEE